MTTEIAKLEDAEGLGLGWTLNTDVTKLDVVTELELEMKPIDVGRADDVESGTKAIELERRELKTSLELEISTTEVEMVL